MSNSFHPRRKTWWEGGKTIRSVAMAIILVPMMHLSAFGATNSNSQVGPPLNERTVIPDESENIGHSEGSAAFKQGVTYANQKEYEKAIEAFKKAESKDFKPYELFIFRGLAYHQIKKYKEAENDASRAIEMQPANSMGYQLRSTIYESTGNRKRATANWEQAIRELSQRIAAVPNGGDGKLYKERGILYLEIGRREEALSDLSHALRLGNAAPLVYYKRGLAYSELGRYREAIQDFSEALQLDHSHNRSLRDRGWVYGCLGEFDKSVQDFDQLISQTPEDVLVHGMRGWVRLEAGDVDGGLSDLAYALEHGDKNPWTYLNIASAYYLKGNIAKAIESNAQGLALNDPQSEGALLFEKGFLLLAAGKGKEAKVSYDRARKLALKNSDRLQLQEAIADLQEPVTFHKEIKGQVRQILRELEKTLSMTKASKELIPTQCQQLRTRQEE